MTLQVVGGSAMILFGLEFAGVIYLPFLNPKTTLRLPKWVGKFEYFRSFFIGVFFAITWTPCVGAVLGGILSLAATSATLTQGVMLLFVYSIGISFPFVLITLTISSAPRYLKKYKEFFLLLTKIAAGILILFGLLLITDCYKYLNAWLLTAL